MVDTDGVFSVSNLWVIVAVEVGDGGIMRGVDLEALSGREWSSDVASDDMVKFSSIRESDGNALGPTVSLNVRDLQVLGVAQLDVDATVALEWISVGAWHGTPLIAVSDDLNVLHSQVGWIPSVDAHAVGGVVNYDISECEVLCGQFEAVIGVWLASNDHVKTW